MYRALALLPLLALAACQSLPHGSGPIRGSLAPQTVADGIATKPVKITDDFASQKPAPNIPATGSATLAPMEQTIWELQDLDGKGTIDNTVTTLRFDGAGRLAGRAGCNTYSAPYTYNNGVLAISPKLFSTKMACPTTLMVQEERFLTLLPKTTRARSNPATGALVLITPQNHTLTFLPSGK